MCKENTKYEEFARPLKGKHLLCVNMAGLTVLSLQSEHGGHSLSAVRTGICESDAPSPCVVMSDSSPHHTYMTMCEKDFKTEPSPYSLRQEDMVTNAPPPYSVTDTKAYFTNIHNYLVPRIPKHSTVV